MSPFVHFFPVSGETKKKKEKKRREKKKRNNSVEKLGNKKKELGSNLEKNRFSDMKDWLINQDR